MTKFILHGGDTSIANVDNDIFFKELVFDQKDNVKVLLNYFAKDEYKWDELAKEDKDRISKLNNNKNITFEVANEENIVNQIKSADCIYFRGGNSSILINKLSKIKNLSLLLENKVVAGSSAGAYALSKYFYNNDDKKLEEGLGILNIKVFCHYDETKSQLVKKLDDYKEKLEIIILPSCKHQIIYG